MKTNDHTKEEWVRNAMTQYEGILLGYARQFTQSYELAQDVVQDTFLKLCQADQAALDGHVKPWLFKVCRNRALEILRKEGRMSTLTESQAANQQSPTPSPAAQADRNDQISQVDNLMKGLSEKQREVLYLKYKNGLSYKEISEVAAVSMSNVGYLLHTSLQTLRTQMQSQ